jgi:adenylate cyclase
MEADEAGTIAALKARRNSVLAPLVSRHRGRVVKLMGDGVLVEFASAVNAVQCAIDLQQAMENANHSSPPERSIALRVGVNLSDPLRARISGSRCDDGRSAPAASPAAARQ